MLTDLTVMALPVYLIWNLQVLQTQKFGIGVVETSISVMIRSWPAFVTLIRNYTTPSMSYNTQGFTRQRQGEESRDGDLDNMKLNAIPTGDRKAETSTKSAGSKDRSWPSRPETRHEMMVGPNDRDVVDEVAEETPMSEEDSRKKRSKMERIESQDSRFFRAFYFNGAVEAAW
ncbi:hypothetical protein BDU57DRAFT_528939 [Ampelomyces quisqualis]|uniref:Integral membrane protein n=1 Tax=Ampelomyces quisqualis TaxID=50730 RepID=A0A6A5QXJ8_AMPQU|nr:hypothetical protein BDU57DRAFT_528939 [Ampelomyces quisqualis]